MADIGDRTEIHLHKGDYTFKIEHGKTGLWYGTSKDKELRGLLVARSSFTECVHAIPKAIADLEAARRMRKIPKEKEDD